MADQQAQLKHEVMKCCVEKRFRTYKIAIWCAVAAYIVLYFVEIGVGCSLMSKESSGD